MQSSKLPLRNTKKKTSGPRPLVFFFVKFGAYRELSSGFSGGTTRRTLRDRFSGAPDSNSGGAMEAVPAWS
jgi:hypothetical protein